MRRRGRRWGKRNCEFIFILFFEGRRRAVKRTDIQILNNKHITNRKPSTQPTTIRKSLTLSSPSSPISHISPHESHPTSPTPFPTPHQDQQPKRKKKKEKKTQTPPLCVLCFSLRAACEASQGKLKYVPLPLVPLPLPPPPPSPSAT